MSDEAGTSAAEGEAPNPRPEEDEDSDSDDDNFYTGAAESIAKGLGGCVPVTVSSDVEDDDFDFFAAAPVPVEKNNKTANKTVKGRKRGREKETKVAGADVVDVDAIGSLVDEPSYNNGTLPTFWPPKRKKRGRLSKKEKQLMEEQEAAMLEDDLERFKASDNAYRLKLLQDKHKNEVTPLPLIDDVVVVPEEDPDVEVPVKVRFRENIVRICLKKSEKLYRMFEELAKQADKPISSVMIFHDNRRVGHSDTPEGLGITIADILEGGIDEPEKTDGPTETEDLGSDGLELKVQSKTQKRATLIKVRKTDSMSILMQKYADEMKVPLESLTFKFDGEELQPSDTPEELDLEGGECIEAYYH